MSLSHHFTYYNQELIVDGIPIKDITQKIKTPFYLYSAEHLRHQYHIFHKAFLAYIKPEDLQIAFAIKSCPNINLLKVLASEGAGADIVSGGELRRALLGNIPTSKIMFSGVGKTDNEIAYALAHNIGMFNVESIAELNQISKISIEKNTIAPISLRVNPDVGTSSFPGISTGKKGDKFGITLDKIEDLYDIAVKMDGVSIKGLDFHIGSGVLDVSEFTPAFEKMRELILRLKKNGHIIEHLDCGGGLGVPYHPDEISPDLDEYAGLVHKYFGDLNLKFAFEPGRFLSANAGILVSSILYEKKDSDDWKCLIIDAAMNDLMRPALYGAYHHIIPAQEFEPDAYTQKYDIVGPVCETTDTFTKDYYLPPLKSGDIICFMTAGAYGASMAGQYNTRPLIPEIMVDMGVVTLIRSRPSIDEMLINELEVTEL